jgi:hypothetical protein
MAVGVAFASDRADGEEAIRDMEGVRRSLVTRVAAAVRK